MAQPAQVRPPNMYTMPIPGLLAVRFPYPCHRDARCSPLATRQGVEGRP